MESTSLSAPEAAAGNKLKLALVGNNRTTGGAFQIWRGDEIVFQGSSYGMPPGDPAPDIWRPIGLIARTGAEYSIFLFIPSNAEAGDYELRIATTVGSRSGSFRVKPG